MPKTRGDLCVEVLDAMGMIGSGDVASADDIGKVNENLDAALAELAARQVYYAPNKGISTNLSSGVFDESSFLAVASALTRFYDSKFGATGQFDGKAVDGEGRLRAMQAEVDIGEPIKACYF